MLVVLGHTVMAMFESPQRDTHLYKLLKNNALLVIAM